MRHTPSRSSTAHSRTPSLQASTRRVIEQALSQLNYAALGPIYCDEGGKAFWHARKHDCLTMGLTIAKALKQRLPAHGRSLYVGAGVAELPMLAMETLDQHRAVEAHNLRKSEVTILAHACHALPFNVQATDAQTARGPFDHLWMVSVLNDPECFPETSALSYGRADPVSFAPETFQQERTRIHALLDACLSTLSIPGLLSTSVEEVSWMTDWLTRHRIPFHVEDRSYPTALVGDPLCFIHLDPTGNKSTPASRHR